MNQFTTKRTDAEVLRAFEAVISKEPTAFLSPANAVYSVTADEVITFAKTLATERAAIPQAGEAVRPNDDELWDKTLKERDDYHEMADRLAEQLAAITATDIGEHSSANNPWENALAGADEYWRLATQQDEKAGQVDPCDGCEGDCASCPYDSPAAPEGKTEASELPDDAYLLDLCRQQTNSTAVQKYGDSFLRIAQAVWRAALAARPPVAVARKKFTKNCGMTLGEVNGWNLCVDAMGIPAPDAEAIRSAVLEEAAAMCEDLIEQHGIHSNFICANAIRALKSQPSPAVKSAE